VEEVQKEPRTRDGTAELRVAELNVDFIAQCLDRASQIVATCAVRGEGRARTISCKG
jgi:hypothetical protein